MCRLAFFPRGCVIEKNEIRKILRKLEESNGGDGNGIAYWRKDGKPKLIKGVNVKVDTLADVIYKVLINDESKSGVVFHTRKASVGGICDELCQPFLITGKGKHENYFFAHNGHWIDYKEAIYALMANGIYLKKYSDTLILALLIKKLKIDEKLDFLLSLRNRFILLFKNSAYLVADHFEVIKATKGFVFASEFPIEYYTQKRVRKMTNGIYDLANFNFKQYAELQQAEYIEFTFRYRRLYTYEPYHYGWREDIFKKDEKDESEKGF